MRPRSRPVFIPDTAFDDGTQDKYFANIIVENLYSQIDSEGRQFLVLEEMTDHRTDDTAIGISDGDTVICNGNKHKKKTARGWEINTKLMESFSEWVLLKDLKESNPVDLAEYAVANRIDHEPAFAWWVPLTLRKRNRIISKLQKKYWQTTHKFGIEIQNTIKRSYEIDEGTGTDFWRNASGIYQRWH